MTINQLSYDQLQIKFLNVIINPVSGTNRDALEMIESALQEHPDIEWKIDKTEKSGDATAFARAAAARGVDLVVAAGGDGTVMEVAAGLQGSGVPMAILPCGTGNLMAVEMGIPLDLSQAIALVLNQPKQLRAVDMGNVDNQPFLLRCGMGYEAEVSAGATRADKSRYGRLAYFRMAWHKLRGLRPVRYTLTLDDQVVVARGITCMVCNSSNVGLHKFQLVPGGDISDGLLDVVVIPSLKPWALLRILWDILRSRMPQTNRELTNEYHWQAARVTVESNHRQMMVRDGEPLKRGTRISAYVSPRVLNIVVPAT